MADGDKEDAAGNLDLPHVRPQTTKSIDGLVHYSQANQQKGNGQTKRVAAGQNHRLARCALGKPKHENGPQCRPHTGGPAGGEDDTH